MELRSASLRLVTCGYTRPQSFMHRRRLPHLRTGEFYSSTSRLKTFQTAYSGLVSNSCFQALYGAVWMANYGAEAVGAPEVAFSGGYAPVPVTQDWIMLPTTRHSFSLMSYVHCGLLILGYATRSSSTTPFKRPRASSHRLDTSSRKLRASRSAPDLQV